MKLKLAPNVAAAISGSFTGGGVVALESTLISHGLPHPDNIEVARSAEDAVRSSGAVPATIAVLDQQAHIGLDDTAINRLATDTGVVKLSRRDLAAAMSSAVNAPSAGATTVSATMILAHHVGIRVFATGGIGGVHRGVADTMDISADLFELAQTPVATVCSGPKVILDLPRTREFLETMGVTVIGYGCNTMPAFWARSSGLPVDMRVDTPQDVASVIAARSDLGIGGSVLVCNPVAEELSIDFEQIESWISGCINNTPPGAAATPWLLAQIDQLSGGRSLAANKRLIIDNAALGGEIAIALANRASS